MAHVLWIKVFVYLMLMNDYDDDLPLYICKVQTQ
jgi:hypothetical protein